MFEGRKGKFISVHGIDGTGKTSTTEAVARSFQAKGIPSINYDTYREGRENLDLEKKKQGRSNASFEVQSFRARIQR